MIDVYDIKSEPNQLLVYQHLALKNDQIFKFHLNHMERIERTDLIVLPTFN